MESFPWPAITAAGGGWLLFGTLGMMVFRGLLSGNLLTKREADAMSARIQYLEKENEELTRQNGLMLHESLPVTNSVLTALRQAAEGDP